MKEEKRDAIKASLTIVLMAFIIWGVHLLVNN